MVQYYVLEIQETEQHEFSHIVHWAYDADASIARLKADAKFCEICTSAAVSQVAKHSVTLIGPGGAYVARKCYDHINNSIVE